MVRIPRKFLGAYCAGLDTVKSMTDDPVISKFLNKVMFDEIVHLFHCLEAERRAYAKTIMERFANPHIRHELISIALIHYPSGKCGYYRPSRTTLPNMARHPLD